MIALSVVFLWVCSQADVCLELLDLSIRGGFDLEHPLTGKNLGGSIGLLIFFPSPFCN